MAHLDGTRAALAFVCFVSLAHAAAHTGDQVRLVPGGTFVRGRMHGRPDEAPVHTVRVSFFYLDETLVTRSAFEQFVDRTRYRTTAERIGFGLVAMEGMLDWEWTRVAGATFRRPFREADAYTGEFLRDDAPVVMVSYEDAVAYCASVGGRLPTEAEWEYAMRGGAEGTRYPWGDSSRRADGKYGLNFWQGASHRKNARRDGYVYVSPVRAFPPNAYGFFDPIGNVWQWTRDWYSPSAYRGFAAHEAVDTVGPDAGEERVLRGGSWWCGECTCSGYGLFYRGKAKPTAPFNNIGFRCAYDRAAMAG